MEDLLNDLLKIVLPAVLVLLATVVVLRNQVRLAQLRAEQFQREETISRLTPLRISAYERAMLYIERIHPPNLVARQALANTSVADLRTRLKMEVNVEYEHNQVQQLYVSNEAWALVEATRHEILALIDSTANNFPPTSPAQVLAEGILKRSTEGELENWRNAKTRLRLDVNRLFA